MYSKSTFSKLFSFLRFISLNKKQAQKQTQNPLVTRAQTSPYIEGYRFAQQEVAIALARQQNVKTVLSQLRAESERQIPLGNSLDQFDRGVLAFCIEYEKSFKSKSGM